MSIQPRQMLVPQSKWNIKCPYPMTAEYITVHNTANDASANNEISYMISNDREVSYHFAIDDKEVVQGIPLNRNAWHAGDGGSGTGNRKTIGMEICYSQSGGDRFTKAEQLAVKFIAQLLDERGWGIDRVKKHQDWSGKYCPHRTLDMGWQRFLDMVNTELKALQRPVLVWSDIEPKTFVTVVNTALYDVPTGNAIRNFGAGVGLDFVQTTTFNGRAYYRTPWSRDNNADNGVPADEVTPAVVEPERLTWTTLDEPKTMIALRDCKLIDLKTGENKKEYPLGEEVGPLVDYTEINHERYYRPELYRTQKKSYGIDSYQLGEKVEPDTELPTIPDGTVVEPPEDSNMITPTQTNWVVALVSGVVNLIKRLFGKGE